MRKFVEIGLLCKSQQVKDILISRLTYTSKVDVNTMSNLNNHIGSFCKKCSFIFIARWNSPKQIWSFKNPNDTSFIDNFLTNRYQNFQNPTTVFTGLSDFHKIVVTVMKISFPKGRPNQITFRDYKTFFFFKISQNIISLKRYFSRY